MLPSFEMQVILNTLARLILISEVFISRGEIAIFVPQLSSKAQIHPSIIKLANLVFMLFI